MQIKADNKGVNLYRTIIDMTHTLEDLKSGKLVGLKRLKLVAELTEFPEEIFSLADTLEILDLSGNQLTELPDRIITLKKLRILFISRNKFTVFPKMLARCPALTMIAFKTNQIHTIPEGALPPTLQWLILTDNKIEQIPKSIGDCPLLQKCMLAGNQIKELPAEMARCKNLELLRISANRLESFPSWLFKLPKLSWVAFSGNPATYKSRRSTDIESYDWTDFTMGKLLGEGASGLISKAQWNTKNQEVAIKVFKGTVTSDGWPEDEMEVSIAVGKHQRLVEVLGCIKNHPEGKSGLVMKLISKAYVNLGHPPSLETCTRDVFEEGSQFSGADILRMAKQIAAVSVALHRKGINHGDLYAHNILVNTSVDKKADCLLSDFGAASFYEVDAVYASLIERIEVRAFGCLLEDLYQLADQAEMDKALHNKWQKLIADCRLPVVEQRLGFGEIEEVLKRF